ncbi:MAG: hypothetical protein ABJA98_34165 [Acidobacteriota bacterium]
MTLRLGCDLDGVFADMDSELIRHAKALFGEAAFRIPPAPMPGQPSHAPAAASTQTQTNATGLGTMDMSERQQRRLWRHVEAIDGFWETLKEIEPGSVERLAALASERRWEVIFLTKRPESAGHTAQRQSQRWLQAHGFNLPSVFVVQGSRGRIADALKLDFVVDDRPDNCVDVVCESTTRALLVWREDETLLPAGARRPGVQVVSSMAECLSLLEQVKESGRERPGVVGWLRRRLGYDESDAHSR